MLDKVLNVIKKSMYMSDDVWFRHANPWSGWTRFSTYPLFILAFWSRGWLVSPGGDALWEIRD